jgi:hypothetical protein
MKVCLFPCRLQFVYDSEILQTEAFPLLSAYRYSYIDLIGQISTSSLVQRETSAKKGD